MFVNCLFFFVVRTKTFSTPQGGAKKFCPSSLFHQNTGAKKFCSSSGGQSVQKMACCKSAGHLYVNGITTVKRLTVFYAARRHQALLTMFFFISGYKDADKE
jgi:hypothetical protein